MAALLDIYLKKETIETILKTLNVKNQNGVSITIATNDETNQYGSNVSAWVGQTKEEVDAKRPKYYVGNGKVFWTDGKITKAVKNEQTKQEVIKSDELPF